MPAMSSARQGRSPSTGPIAISRRRSVPALYGPADIIWADAYVQALARLAGPSGDWLAVLLSEAPDVWVTGSSRPTGARAAAKASASTYPWSRSLPKLGLGLLVVLAAATGTRRQNLARPAGGRMAGSTVAYVQVDAGRAHQQLLGAWVKPASRSSAGSRKRRSHQQEKSCDCGDDVEPATGTPCGRARRRGPGGTRAPAGYVGQRGQLALASSRRHSAEVGHRRAR